MYYATAILYVLGYNNASCNMLQQYLVYYLTTIPHVLWYSNTSCTMLQQYLSYNMIQRCDLHSYTDSGKSSMEKQLSMALCDYKHLHGFNPALQTSCELAAFLTKAHEGKAYCPDPSREVMERNTSTTLPSQTPYSVLYYSNYTIYDAVASIPKDCNPKDQHTLTFRYP